VAAVALRLLAAHLPGPVQGTEAVLIGVGFVYAGAAIALRYTPWGETPVGQLTLTGGGIALATAVLAVAGPWLPDLVPLAIGVTCSFLLTVDPTQTRRFMAAVLALGITGLVVLSAEALLVLHRPPLELAVYGMVLTAIVMLVFVTLRLVTDRLNVEVHRTKAIANDAQRVGWQLTSERSPGPCSKLPASPTPLPTRAACSSTVPPRTP